MMCKGSAAFNKLVKKERCSLIPLFGTVTLNHLKSWLFVSITINLSVMYVYRILVPLSCTSFPVQ